MFLLTHGGVRARRFDAVVERFGRVAVGARPRSIGDGVGRLHPTFRAAAAGSRRPFLADRASDAVSEKVSGGSHFFSMSRIVITGTVQRSCWLPRPMTNHVLRISGSEKPFLTQNDIASSDIAGRRRSAIARAPPHDA
jgi:hypothetical protein